MLNKLAEKSAMATVAVRDINMAKSFYGGTLGLKESGAEGEDLIRYRCGDSTLLVYRSEYAATNQATAVTWGVGEDLEDIVHALQGQGVAFEHYELPGLTRKGDIHVGAGIRIAWLRDPDGNILSINSQ
ncbi:VOC family protein [Rugamonas sp.]|uniref:VOC family protein n=1 Tax=Rugamonas sp. TaxID=1926287 RepID=UPI0025CBFD7F|nr:VOC family protein [Rugamonas sp.]